MSDPHLVGVCGIYLWVGVNFDSLTSYAAMSGSSLAKTPLWAKDTDIGLLGFSIN